MLLSERFWTKVDKSGECWNWTGHKRNGYGGFWDGHRTVVASRVAYELSIGPIPNYMHVLHRCDNPACCNPAHLFVGTNADNVADKIQKGRARYASGDRSAARLHPNSYGRGEDQPRAKLKIVDVLAIRELYKTGTTSERKLAAQFGVSNRQIHRILHEQQWPASYCEAAAKVVDAPQGTVGVNPWDFTREDQEAIWHTPDVICGEVNPDMAIARAAQRKLVEWLKGQLWEYTGKTKDMRINKATWRALCESLGVAP
jgi:hypothetical protein